MIGRLTALERLLHPSVGDLPSGFAQQLLKLDFEPADKVCYAALSEKSQVGTLTDEERLELDDLLTANDVLIILQAKATTSLDRHSAA